MFRRVFSQQIKGASESLYASRRWRQFLRTPLLLLLVLALGAGSFTLTHAYATYHQNVASTAKTLTIHHLHRQAQTFVVTGTTHVRIPATGTRLVSAVPGRSLSVYLGSSQSYPANNSLFQSARAVIIAGINNQGNADIVCISGITYGLWTDTPSLWQGKAYVSFYPATADDPYNSLCAGQPIDFAASGGTTNVYTAPLPITAGKCWLNPTVYSWGALSCN